MIIQARMGSTRLPGKVMRPILGQPVLWHIVQRLRYVQDIEEVLVATSDQPGDEIIRHYCSENGIPVFAGSESNVLDRFYQAALYHKGDPLIRITADCPFIDPMVITGLIQLYRTGRYDHVGVATGAGAVFLEGGRYPDGLDAECFSFAALGRAWREAADPQDQEHVTPYIWRNKEIFRCGVLKSEKDYSQLRWTLDHEADFQLVSQVYEALYRENEPFLMQEILDFLEKNPQLTKINQGFIGKEGYLELWNHWGDRDKQAGK